MRQFHPAIAARSMDEAAEWLVRALRNGDPDACEALYDRFGAPIHRYAARLLRQHDDMAEDVMVLTLAEATRNIRHFDDDRATFRAWLFGIARQKALAELRQRRRSKAVPGAALVSLESAAEQADPGDLADSSSARIDAQRQVARIVGCLSPLEFEVLVLRSVHQYSLREIGHVVRRSERAVEALLRRAKIKARERLGREND